MAEMDDGMRRETEQLEREKEARRGPGGKSANAAAGGRKVQSEDGRRAHSERHATRPLEQRWVLSLGRASRSYSVVPDTRLPQALHKHDSRREVRRLRPATAFPFGAVGVLEYDARAGVGSKAKSKAVTAMTRPRRFDGTSPSCWMSRMEHYLISPGVTGELHGPGFPYSSRTSTVWSGLRSLWEKVNIHRPGGNEGIIREHSSAVSESEALNRVTRARQVATVEDYLVTLNKAAAECPRLFAVYTRTSAGSGCSQAREHGRSRCGGGGIEVKQADRNREVSDQRRAAVRFAQRRALRRADVSRSGRAAGTASLRMWGRLGAPALSDAPGSAGLGIGPR